MNKCTVRSNKIDMCNGPIAWKLLLFAGPLMLSSILQLMFNAADVIVVGKFAGDNSLAAVGSVSSVVNLLVNFFMGLSIGANVMASRYYGSKDDEGLSKVLHTSMLVSVISGVLLLSIGVPFAGQILKWMQSPPEVIGLATLYLRIYFLGMPASMVYNFGSAILRAVGDTKRPMYYLTFSGVVNVILNLIFVIAFGMDVAGVAIATVVSQIISAALVVRCLMKETGALKFSFSKLSIDKMLMGKIVSIGLPASIQSMLFSFSNVIIQSSVNSFGATILAGNSAGQSVEGFVYVAMNAFYQACISFVSANVGAGNYKRINPIVLRAELLVAAVGILAGNLVYLLRYQVLSLYTDSPAVMEAAAIRLAYIVIPYFLCGIMDTMVGALRGLGYSILPMIVSLIGACGLRLFWIFTFFQLPAFHEPKYLYITYPVSWAITFMAHLICYTIVYRKNYVNK